MKYLTVSIPVYNDSDTIEQLINDTYSLLNNLGIEFEILVINDGSDDNSLKIIQDINQRLPIVVQNHTVNKGFGPTIKECYCLPESEWIMNLSGDYQFPVENVLILLKQTKENNIILGVRENRQDSIFRKINSWVYNLVISILARKRIYDVNSILLIKKSVLKGVDIKSKSAFIHAELFLKSIREGNSFKQIKIMHKSRLNGKASGGNPNIILFTIFDVIRYVFGKL